ncbi:MAG: endonuclease I family protein [Bacteriovoracaceae bacterium]
MKQTLIFALIFASFNVFGLGTEKLPNGDLAYYPKTFYANLKAGKVSIDELYNILSDSHSATTGDYDQVGRCATNCYAHKAVGYDPARQIMFSERDVQSSGGEQFIIDVYCGKKFTVKDSVGGHVSVNIEHTWPQSKFNSKYDKVMQKSDMHHLYLTDSQANSDRGNHEFGISNGAPNEGHAQNCPQSKLFRGEGDMLFEPPTGHRGNVARSLFYFSVRYQLPISKKQEAALRIWHKADPVDEMEKKKADIVTEHQHTRNPFVDFPQLVDQIADF